MPAFNADLGGSAATSYITVTEADAWHAGTAQAAAWGALSEAEKEAALMAATLQLDTLSFIGTRCSPSSDDPALEQALQWPRSDATCRGSVASCSMLPKELVAATAYLALAVHQAPLTTAAAAITGPIQSQTLGELSQSFYAPTATTVKVSAGAPLVLQQYPFLVDLLGCWYAGGTGGSGLILRVRA
jgi:hypothetical protein